MKTNVHAKPSPLPGERFVRKTWKKAFVLFFVFSLTSTAGYSQWVVTDFYNGVINTVSQIIQSASKIINSEAFQHAVKIHEKLKDVQSGVQQYRRIQEIGQAIQGSAQSYKLALDVISKDKHFSPNEIGAFYQTLEKLVVQDAKLLDDLQKGIQANLLEMNSADRLEFINTIWRDATASEERLKTFISGMETLSLRRAYTTNDKIKTMQLYASARNGGSQVIYDNVNFGEFTEGQIDWDSMEQKGLQGAQSVSQQQNDWMNDPNNPIAKEAAVRNILSDPMPQEPEKPGAFASAEKWDRYNQLMMTYPDRLENWHHMHEKDLTLLGTELTRFVQMKPSELSDQEWMQVLVNKMRKGQI